MKCIDCMAEARRDGSWDFTADDSLLLYLATGDLPPGTSPAAARRLVAAGEHLFWDGARLWYTVGDWEREVPPRWRRRQLVDEAQASLGYPGGRRLYALLKTRWYWPRMVSDCVELCSAALPFALEHAKFTSPTYLIPTRKDLWPLHTMAVDLITGLKYPDGTLSSILAVAICVFSKWLEAEFLANRSSREVTRWFHESIVCRFGTPCVVRTDHGLEF